MMTLKEVMKRLEEIKAEHGDDVDCYFSTRSTEIFIEAVDFFPESETEYEAVVFR